MGYRYLAKMPGTGAMRNSEVAKEGTSTTPSKGGLFPPMTGGALAITATALALGTFMQVLDNTIANVSLPTIAGNLGASTDQGTWGVTSFIIDNGSSWPPPGWVMTRYWVVKTFIASVLAFTVTSFLCGIAWS